MRAGADAHVCLTDRMAGVDVRDNPDRQRYEAWVDGSLAGYTTYRLTERAIIFIHTEVDPRFQGMRVGPDLVRGALDDVRAHGGRRVIPRCPFVRGWISRHPEYADLTRSVASR